MIFPFIFFFLSIIASQTKLVYYGISEFINLLVFQNLSPIYSIL